MKRFAVIVILFALLLIASAQIAAVPTITRDDATATPCVPCRFTPTSTFESRFTPTFTPNPGRITPTPGS